MQWTDRIRQVKIALVSTAVVICTASLLWSHLLVRDLAKEEQAKVEVWAEAMRSLDAADDNTDLSLVLTVLEGNRTIPVIVTSSDGDIHDYRNLELSAKTAADTLLEIRALADDMKASGRSMRIYLTDSSETANGGAEFMEICYDESVMLKRLARYPYIQLGIVTVFAIIAVFALLSSKRAEQNKVWVGLSKETAHQLGTPISSLMAWGEVLRETYPDDELLPEMDKDVKRLQRIAERFSKIGSLPELKPENLNDVINSVVSYISRRAASHIQIITDLPEQPIYADVCAPLFEWVVENLCKNAIDAMNEKGTITISGTETATHTIIDVSDTGKGIMRNHFKSVFYPGYTTKKRGWGLGLSLAKRIVEEYHKGRIYVASSEIGKGTTFRIELPK
ncbi:MAG: HAMP domain-containing histidine kinase [Bacteroidaceae bacterium]|nr:HAMP domain-containing histidine kinase [Bacteroidaceae bacterium]